MAIEFYQVAIDVGGDYLYQASHNLAHLYASIGRIEEALAFYDVAVVAATHLTDKATSITEHARLLIGMGKEYEAIELLHTAIKYNNLNLNQYLPLVLAYKKLNNLSIEEWKELIKVIEKSIEGQVRRKGILGDSEIGYSSSNSVGRDVYWALFEAYDKIGQFGKAWQYLEKAQKYVIDFQYRNFKSISRTTRDSVVSEDVLLHNILSKTASRKIKHRGGYGGATGGTVLGNNQSSLLNNDPVFVIGMPRCVWTACTIASFIYFYCYFTILFEFYSYFILQILIMIIILLLIQCVDQVPKHLVSCYVATTIYFVMGKNHCLAGWRFLH